MRAWAVAPISRAIAATSFPASRSPARVSSAASESARNRQVAASRCSGDRSRLRLDSASPSGWRTTGSRRAFEPLPEGTGIDRDLGLAVRIHLVHRRREHEVDPFAFGGGEISLLV